MEKPLRAVIEGILVGVIISILAMVFSIIPILSILILLFPVPLVVVGIKEGPWQGLLA